MSTQQDIYAAGSESRPPMLNKENYVPWSSRHLRYAKSRQNGKLIHNSILNGPYVRRMIAEPGDGEHGVGSKRYHVVPYGELDGIPVAFVARKLKTQDLIPRWDISHSLGLVCPLYEGECSVACAIWNRMKSLAGLSSYSNSIFDSIQRLIPIAKRRTSKSVIAKLVISATAYFIWQERNWRLFKKGKRSQDQICECIKSSVRLKLLS
nr:hypothetical protein [Tanacetum cinerariifolium]